MRRLRVPLLVVAPIVLFGCQQDSYAPSEEEWSSTPSTAAATAAQSYRQLITYWTTCGVTTDNRAFCGRAPDLRATATAYRFLEVHEGGNFTCGLTTEQRVYCWGLNDEGQLGDGTPFSSSEPVEVAGGRRYRRLSAGEKHACAITLSEVTFCWGYNAAGQLGDGTTTSRRAPVRVARGINFRMVSAGRQHTCGINQANVAYCWGLNGNGQIGNRSPSLKLLTPVGVADGHAFDVLSAGMAHTCGVTIEHRAYCWGWNRAGELGDGTTSRRSRPTLVVGGIRFAGLSAGASYTCGVTTAKVAYCWGANYSGQLGDGTEGVSADRHTPVRVKGGILFTMVGAAKGGNYTCGVASGGRGYCWGSFLGTVPKPLP